MATRPTLTNVAAVAKLVAGLAILVAVIVGMNRLYGEVVDKATPSSPTLPPAQPTPISVNPSLVVPSYSVPSLQPPTTLPPGRVPLPSN